MPTRTSLNGKEAREQLLKGMMEISVPVKSTLGPCGKTVVIGIKQPDGLVYPLATKDGATVAKYISPVDEMKAPGANMIKQAAIETATVAGDSTTTATVIAENLISNGMKLVEEGANPHILKEGMEEAAKRVIESLKKMAIPCEGEMAKHVAVVSANGNKEIGQNVFEAYKNLSENGTVLITKKPGAKTRVESVEGMIVKAGTFQQYMNTGRKCVLNNPVIFVTTEVLSTTAQVKGIAEYCQQRGRSLLIIAENSVGEAQSFLLRNKEIVPSCVVCLPSHVAGYHDILGDISAVTGARVLGKATNSRMIENARENESGGASFIEAYNDRLIIAGGAGESREERVAFIKDQLEEAGNDDQRILELNERLAGVDGGISIIHVGADTEIELNELYTRYEDAVMAVKVAKKGGVLPGGGTALRTIFNSHTREVVQGDRMKGEMILIDSLLSPFMTIMANCNLGGERENEILAALRVDNTPFQYGYDFRNNVFGDMIEMEIIDPLIAQTTAIEKAVSVAGTFITTDHLLINS